MESKRLHFRVVKFAYWLLQIGFLSCSIWTANIDSLLWRQKILFILAFIFGSIAVFKQMKKVDISIVNDFNASVERAKSAKMELSRRNRRKLKRWQQKNNR